MRIAAIVFLSLLVFCKLASAVDKASIDEATGCPLGDTECINEMEEARLIYSSLFTTTDSVPFPDTESSLMRLDPHKSWNRNRVNCWPSIGGYITAENVHAVELDYIGLDRFHSTPRSTNSTDEDAFCMKLRKMGGKWWESYDEWDLAITQKSRMLWPDEREILLLGWPEDGGVWVLRYDNKRLLRGEGPTGPVWNALSMAERCMTLKENGAVYFEKPEESEVVAPLLKGFGKIEGRKQVPGVEDDGWMELGR